MEAEFDALGVPFRERGRRMDEGIAMMKAVWSDDPVSFPTRWIPAKIETMRMQPQAVRADPDLDRRFVGCGDRARAAAGWLARQPRDARAGAGDGAASARRPAGCGVHHLAAHGGRRAGCRRVARQAGGIQGGRRAARAGGAGGYAASRNTWRRWNASRAAPRGCSYPALRDTHHPRESWWPA